MFEILFGLIWTSITAILTFVFYSGTSGEIYVNDELVSQAEFNEMLWPKLFFGIFWAIGLFMIYWGLKRIIKDKKTNAFGEICYGKITDIFESGTYINEVPELKAQIVLYIPSINDIKIVSEVIGLYGLVYNYEIGKCVEVKYYNGDINFEKVLDIQDLPYEAQEILNEFKTEMPKEKVMYNGVEYIRKDLVDKI